MKTPIDELIRTTFFVDILVLHTWEYEQSYILNIGCVNLMDVNYVHCTLLYYYRHDIFVWHKRGWNCLFIKKRQWWQLLETTASAFTMRWVNICICNSTHSCTCNISSLLIFGLSATHMFFYVCNILCMRWINWTYVLTLIYSDF